VAASPGQEVATALPILQFSNRDLSVMRFRRISTLLKGTYHSLLQHNQLNNAAALSFFFFLSLPPLLIFLVSLMALIPSPNLDENLVRALSHIVPADAMGIVRRLLASVFQSNRRLLSLGILGVLWAGSTGFNSMIVALNGAYGVKEARPLWKRQLVAVGLTIVVGALLLAALLLLFLGSRIGFWLAVRLRIDPVFTAVWPYIRWFVVVGFTAVSVEMLYFIAPHVKQRFLAQIPGAAVAVVLWLASSFGLGLYLRSFTQFTAIYGTLGAMIALMLWFYFSSLAMLIGAELNAQIQRADSGHGAGHQILFG
jgi:membrane protein